MDRLAKTPGLQVFYLFHRSVIAWSSEEIWEGNADGGRAFWFVITD